MIRGLSRPISLRKHFLGLVLAAMLPFFFLVFVTFWWIGDYERGAMERRLQRAASELAVAVDNEAEVSVRILRVLARSKELEKDDLEGLHAELQSVLKDQRTWDTILLHETAERPTLSAIRPFGTSLEPSPDVESLERAFSSKEPVVGPLTFASSGNALNGTAGFAVRLPVIRDNQVRYVLSAILTSQTIQPIVARFFSSSDEWTRTIVDSKGRVVARSRAPERFVGQLATLQFREALTRHDNRSGATVTGL
jgi:hypothetical protein